MQRTRIKFCGMTRVEDAVAAARAGADAIGMVLHAESARRITRETARNHLKSVFLKTDTHRQSQLVALLARL